MRETLALLLSWVAASVIGQLTLMFDGMSILHTDSKVNLIFFSLIALCSAIYILIFCVPVLYFLFKRQIVSRVHFLCAGLISSMPMALLGVFANELEWVIGPLFAGLVGGSIFAMVLANQHTPNKEQLKGSE